MPGTVETKQVSAGQSERPIPTGRTLLEKIVSKVFEVYCKGFLFSIYCPVKVVGRDNLPESPFILCSNHCSHMDSAVLMVASGMPFRRFGMMAAADYFFNHKARKLFLSAMMNLIPIDRTPSFRSVGDVVESCRTFLQDRSRNIIIFPEGTRSLTGEIQGFKKGPSIISHELKVPLVPAYIHGTFRAMPKGRNFMKPHRVIVTIGKPIYPEEFPVEDGSRLNKTYRLITNSLENAIRDMVKENGLAK